MLLDDRFRVTCRAALVPAAHRLHRVGSTATLSGGLPAFRATLYRYDFTDRGRQPPDPADAGRPARRAGASTGASQDAWRIWLLAIPLYVAAAGFFIR